MAREVWFFFSVSCFPLSRAYEFERNNHAKYLLMIIFIKAHNGMEVGAEGEHIALYAPPPPKNHYKKKRNQWIVTCLYRGSHLRIDPWVSANNTSAKWINGGSMNTNSGVVQLSGFTFFICKMGLMTTSHGILVHVGFHNQEPETG